MEPLDSSFNLLFGALGNDMLLLSETMTNTSRQKEVSFGESTFFFLRISTKFLVMHDSKEEYSMFQFLLPKNVNFRVKLS